MAGIIAICPSCSQPNEVEPILLGSGARELSCWFCASLVPVVPGQMPEDVRSPFGHPLDAPPSLSATAKALGGLEDPSPRVSVGLGKIAVIGAMGLVAVGAVVGVVLLIGSALTASSSVDAGQFRAAYHQGDATPTGTKAWQNVLAPSGGFSIARDGATLFAVGNRPRSLAGEAYSPPGVPEDLLPRVRALHGRMASEGFRALGRPSITALQPRQQERFRVNMRQSTCYRVAAFGGEGVRSLSLLMYQPDGVSPVVADTRGERDGYIEHCPTRAGEYQFELRMGAGGGIVAWTVYLESEDPSHAEGRVLAVEATRGTTIWERELPVEVSTSPAFSQGSVVVGTTMKRRSSAAGRVIYAGSLVVLSSLDGSDRCTFEAAGPVESSPFVHEGVAYFGSCGEPAPSAKRLEACRPGAEIASAVHAVRVEDCTEVWRHATAYHVVNTPVSDGTRVFYTAGSRLEALSARTGEIIWSVESRGLAGAPSVRDRIVVHGTSEGRLHAYSVREGQQRWVVETDADLDATPAICSTAVLGGSGDGSVHAIARSSGRRLWDVRVSAAVEAPLTDAAGLAIVLAGRHVVGLDPEDGAARFDLEVGSGFGPRCAPVVVDGVLYVADDGGSLFAVR